MLTLFALAIAPAIFLGIVIYGYDKYDREPKKILAIAFILGGVSVIPAALIEEIWVNFGFDVSPSFLKTAFFAFIVVALTEELVKFFMLRIHAYKQSAFNEPFDGIVYGTFVALGFATVENLFYVFEHGAVVGVIRMFTAVPAHFAFGVIMGYFVGKAKFDRVNARSLMFKGVFFAVITHGLYDFFIFQENIPALAVLTFVVLIIAIYISIKAVKELQKDSQFRFHRRNNQDVLDD